MKTKKLIGTGTYGNVFLLTDGNVAKISDVDEYTIREIAITSGCHHPNIIPLISVEKSEDIHIESGKLAMIYPYAEEMFSYEHYVGDGDFNWDWYIIDMYKLISALNYLHDKSIVHSDIKYGNILIRHNEPFIIDFGLSSFCRSFYTGDLNCTLIYCPPEGLTGKYSTKTDIWSLGVLFHYACTHSVLFNNESDIKNKNIDSCLNHQVKNNFVRMMLKLMIQRDPKMRPTSYQLLSLFPFHHSFKQSYVEIPLNIDKYHFRLLDRNKFDDLPPMLEKILHEHKIPTLTSDDKKAIIDTVITTSHYLLYWRLNHPKLI